MLMPYEKIFLFVSLGIIVVCLVLIWLSLRKIVNDNEPCDYFKLYKQNKNKKL